MMTLYMDVQNSSKWIPFLLSEVDYLALELLHHLPAEKADKLMKSLRAKEKAVQEPFGCLKTYLYKLYMAQPWAPPPPPPGDGHGSLPRPLWEWVGWLWMGGNAG